VGKKVLELAANLGVAEIVEGKLEGTVRLETESARRGSESGDGVLGTGVQEGEGKLARKLQRGDVVLMVLLAKEQKGVEFRFN
jgi:hypothetical protein